MPNGDDLDARFNELVAQIDEDERRRMRTAATRGARAPRSDKATRPRRAGRGLLAAGLVAAVIGGATVIVAARPDLLTPQAGSPGPVPEETQPVMAAPAPEPTGTEAAALGEKTAADPFEGSPAEKYAEGTAGFVMPKAKALGGLSKKEVAKALDRTRDLLAAAYLDHKTLVGGKPKAFIERLDARQRDWYRDQLDIKQTKKPRFDGRYWVNSFAPKTAELATGVIKVRGESTVKKLAKYGREGAEVKVKYLVVYAVQRPGQPATVLRFVSRVEGQVLVYRESGRLVTWVRNWGRRTGTPGRCDVKDAFLHPAYRDSAPDKTSARATDPPTDPYDLDRDLPRDKKCHRSRRT
ncbi:hypothetical protein AB0H88_02220 [Nonomuraea sp. NPDC050680]|uniref:hypothetical protein n=1 Tax=Nonomuraea sp. NPDC050680 TaxID=3154630 RepID=UPI0033CE143A